VLNIPFDAPYVTLSKREIDHTYEAIAVEGFTRATDGEHASDTAAHDSEHKTHPEDAGSGIVGSGVGGGVGGGKAVGGGGGGGDVGGGGKGGDSITQDVVDLQRVVAQLTADIRVRDEHLSRYRAVVNVFAPSLLRLFWTPLLHVFGTSRFARDCGGGG
jgi:hypothetical protein